MEKNSALLWDGLWKVTPSKEEEQARLNLEAGSIRWKRIEKIVIQRFGGFEGISVIEVGSGRATYAALMAKNGANVTVLDYSKNALELSRIFFEFNGIRPH